MSGLLRAFLLAPSRAEHRRHQDAVAAFMPHLSDAEVMEAAYRHSGARQTAFAFAQGAVVGTMGNLFASAVGHFIDRGAGTPTGGDAAWAALGLASILLIGSTTWGALRRHRLNTEIERLFLREARRRGGTFAEETADVDEPDEAIGD
ncbi:MAG: hypothetical protein ABR562_03125 [Thermoplasmatota archaeon]